MNVRAIKVLSVAVLLGLALAACQPSRQIPVKPTPTAAPGVTPAAGQPAGAQPAGRIVTEGRVVPAQSAALAFATGGVLAQVPVKVGDQVTAGQTLAQLETSVLELQLAQAEANLAGAKARLAQLDVTPAEEDIAAANQAVASAQATYDKLTAGPSAADMNAAQAALTAAQQNLAQVRAGPSADELTQLQAGVANAAALMAQAQAAYDQVKNSPDIAMLPQSLALQQATNAHAAAEAAYRAATRHPTAAELAAATAQVQAAQAALDRLTPDAAQVQNALANLKTARARLAELERPAPEGDRAVLEAGLQAAQAGRDLAAAQIENAALAAPFDGVVMKINVTRGEYTAPGAEVLLLAAATEWRIETTGLTELNVAEVAEGATAVITFDALPDVELTGRVSKIDPYGETRQGDIVYTATILLDKQDPRLRWNMTAKVKIGQGVR